MIRSILVAVDGSEVSQRALDIAADLARGVGAKLTVVSAVSAPGGDALFEDPALVAQEASEAEAAEVQLATARERFADLAVETKAVGFPAAKSILALADQIGADLIVVGPHRRSFFHGSVGSTILDHARVSVLVAR